MGTAHLVLTIIQFSWLALNYTLFCYIMFFARITIKMMSKKQKDKYLFLIGAMYLFFAIIPLTITMVETLLNNVTPVYLFEFFIYAYATYAFIKLTIAIKNMIKYKNGSEEVKILSWLSIIAALFTVFMLEYSMIRTFSMNPNPILYTVELIFQGLIILFTISILIYFIFKFFRGFKTSKKEHK